jgi:thioredoxin reductase (NADPH)
VGDAEQTQGVTDQPIGAGQQETVDREGAFPRLDVNQMARFRNLGRVREVESGEVLFCGGDESSDFFIVESGVVAIVEGYGEENRVIGIHGPGRFLGELSLLTSQELPFTGVVRESGAVIQVPLDSLRKIVAEDKALSDLVLGAFISRRNILVSLGAGIKLIGSRFSPETRRLREFLARNRVANQWIDLEADEEAETLLKTLSVDPADTPVVVTAGGQILRNPSNSEVSNAIGLSSARKAPPLCDLIVVGSGPAGMSAALYAASEGLDVLTVESVAAGGQAGTTERIENYLGFPAGVSGGELVQRAGVQAAKFGARLEVPAEAMRLESEGDRHRIHLSNGDSATGRAVVIATGAHYRRLDVPRLDELEGVGVYYAATQVEAQMCSGDPVSIVGGGNSAGQAAMFLSRQATQCRILIRGDDLGNSMSRYLVDHVERNSMVEVCKNTEVVELIGDRELESITIENNVTGERTQLSTRALFVFIGAVPHTNWLEGQLACDDAGFLLTGRDVQGDDLAEYDGDLPLFLETSRQGIFAVGDVHSGSIKRVASAVGEGSMAVRLVHQRLAGVPSQV